TCDRLRRGARGPGDRRGESLHRARDPALRRHGRRAGRGCAPRLIRLTLAMAFCYARRAFVSITTAAFYLLAIFTAGSALGVALTHNIVYSAFALIGALLGTGGGCVFFAP